MQLAIACIMTFLRGLLNVVLMVRLSLHVLLVLVIPRSTNCDSLMELGRSLSFANLISVSQGSRKMSEFLFVPNISECYFWSFRGISCLAKQFSSPLFDNFFDALFQHKMVRNDGVDAVCQNSFLRHGQVNSVLCILFRSSMHLIIHIHRLLDICNCFCFVCIADGEDNCLISLFTFFFSCHQSIFCNRVLIW